MEKMSLAPGPLHLLILFVANAQFQSCLFFLIYLFMALLSLPCSVWTSFHWRQAGATLHCNVWALGVKSFSSYGLQAQSLWCTGLVAPQHVESSRSRDRTHVPCVGRRILIHCTTKEVPSKPLSAGILGLLQVLVLAGRRFQEGFPRAAVSS